MLAIAFASAFAATTAGAEPFNSPTAGVSVGNPGNWQFLTLKEFRESMGRTDIGNKDLTKLMLKKNPPPLIGFLKFKEPYPNLNPGFSVGAFWGASGEMSALSMCQYMVQARSGMASNLVVEKAATETTFDGMPAAYSRMTFTARYNNGREYHIWSEIMVVERGPDLVVLASILPADASDDVRGELRTITESVKLDVGQ